MLHKLKTLTVATLLSASFACADGGNFVDLKFGAGSWSVDAPTGEFGQSPTDAQKITFANLGLKESTASYMWAEFQHGIPLIPHIRAEYSQMSFTGTGTQSYTFGGYTVAASVESEIVLDNVDAILYYDIGAFDGMLDFNFGVGAKIILGELTAVTTAPLTGTNVVDIGAPAVYAYIDTRFELPYGIGIEVEHKWFPGGDVDLEFTETIAKVDYTVEIAVLKLGVEVGQRQMDLKIYLPEDQVYVNFGFSGLFAGVFMKLEI